MSDYIMVLVTCGSRREARKIARSVVQSHLAACVNVPQAAVESTYRWRGEVETAREVLLLIKTTRKQYAALEAEVRRLHSYDVPEVIAVPIERGSKAYLDWIAHSVGPAATRIGTRIRRPAGRKRITPPAPSRGRDRR